MPSGSMNGWAAGSTRTAPSPPGTVVVGRNGNGWMAAVRTVGDSRRAEAENLGVLMTGAATLDLSCESGAQGPRHISVVSISDDGAGTDFTGNPSAAVRWICH